MKFKRKRNIIDEYFINENYLKKLYNLYIKQTLFEKILDGLVFFAIIFTIMSLVLELFMDLNDEVLHLIHISSTIIIFIFVIDLLLEYSRSKTSYHFFKSYWIDFILIVFLSFYFLFATYFGIARLERLVELNSYVKRMKHIKVSFSYFQNLFKTRKKR